MIETHASACAFSLFLAQIPLALVPRLNAGKHCLHKGWDTSVQQPSHDPTYCLHVGHPLFHEVRLLGKQR